MLGKRKPLVRHLFYIKDIKKITIIIPTFNNLENLQSCITSIQNQTISNYEVWIVDGNSTDGTKDFLTTLEAPFYSVSETDKGIYDAMNKGIALSKGEWLYFLGADDTLFDTNVLEKIAAELEIKYAVVSGKITYDFQKSDSAFVKNNRGVFTSTWSFILWLKNTVHHQSVFYNRRIFEKEKYVESYKVLSDYAFNLRLYTKKPPTKTIDIMIAFCKTTGVSKNYHWKLYREEIQLKTTLSSRVLQPLFFSIAALKYIAKKMV